MSKFLAPLLKKIKEGDSGQEAFDKLRARIAQLTMPPRALGRLLDLAEDLTYASCGQSQALRPHLFLFVCEHGVADEGVSVYPKEVTQQMLDNFLAGGAAINQLVGESEAQLTVINVATSGIYSSHVDFVDQPVAASTANLLKESALQPESMEQAILLGYQLASKSIEEGTDLIAGGEMGIANTTSSACLTVALTACTVEQAVGPGTGLDVKGLDHKRQVVAQALERVGPCHEPLLWLQQVGGYDHAGLVGVILACAVQRVPFVLDGVNVAAAAAVAVALEPRVREVLIASHLGSEPGHEILLDHLKLKPWLDWNLRLGEGSGAALLFPLCRMACQVVQGMATFEQAHVSDKNA